MVPATLFTDLSRNVSWEQPDLEVDMPAHNATVNLNGRGLLLVPSAFAASHPFVIDSAPWQPTVSYPARGIATLWEEPPATSEGLARLLGSSRAAMLVDLAAPRSTIELAARLSSAPPPRRTISPRLRDGGLVTARRDGRSVLYARTPLGDALAETALPA